MSRSKLEWPKVVIYNISIFCYCICALKRNCYSFSQKKTRPKNDKISLCVQDIASAATVVVIWHLPKVVALHERCRWDGLPCRHQNEPFQPPRQFQARLQGNGIGDYTLLPSFYTWIHIVFFFLSMYYKKLPENWEDWY